MKFLCDFKLVSSLLAPELLHQCSSHSLSPSPLFSQVTCIRHATTEQRTSSHRFPVRVRLVGSVHCVPSVQCVGSTAGCSLWLSIPPPPSPSSPSEELGTVWKWFIFEKIYIPLQVCPLELCHVITKVCNHVWLRSSHCFPCKMLCHAAHLMFYYLTKKKEKNSNKNLKTENVSSVSELYSLALQLQTTQLFSRLLYIRPKYDCFCNSRWSFYLLLYDFHCKK